MRVLPKFQTKEMNVMLHSYLDWNEEEHLEIGVLIFQGRRSLLWGPRSGFFTAHNDSLTVASESLVQSMWVDKRGSTPSTPRIHAEHFPAGSLAHYKGGIYEVLASDLDFVFLKVDHDFLAVSRKFDLVWRVQSPALDKFKGYK